MKQLKCNNGELIKLDDDVYNLAVKYNWCRYSYTDRKPSVVAYIDGTEVHIIHMVKPAKRWTHINGDTSDYQRENILIRDGAGDQKNQVKVNAIAEEKKQWTKIAKDKGHNLSTWMRIVMNKECGK